MKPSWRELAVRVWRESQSDDVFGQAAELSYYFLFAIFPLLLFLTTLFGLLAKTGSEAYENLLSYGRQMLPYSAFNLLAGTLKEVTTGAGKGKLSVGILVTIWAAASGMSALMDGLNLAYEVKERRPWWKSRILAIGLTLMFSVFFIAAGILVLYGTRVGEMIAGYFGLETYFTAAWTLLEWPIAVVILLIAFTMLYRFAPDVKNRRWHVVVPGAVTAMILWVVVSLAFKLYLEYFNSYNATYGSLGAVIVLMLWFYLSGVAILVGAELNSELSKIAQPI